jgi:dynein heavy chain
MSNSNVPKFLKEDLPLFEALLRDLFPHVEIVNTVPTDLEEEINRSYTQLKLQEVKGLTKKIIQLY